MSSDDFQSARAAALSELAADLPTSFHRVMEFSNRYSKYSSSIEEVTICIMRINIAEEAEERGLWVNKLRKIIETVELNQSMKSEVFLPAAIRLASSVEKALQERVRGAAPLVVCQRVGKTYRRRTFQLSDISLSAQLQSITAVVGRNGSGKSTLFNIVSGRSKHTTGQLSFPYFQQEHASLDWQLLSQKIAYVPQEIPPWRGSLKENIQYEAAVHGLLGAENERETSFVIERLGLGDFLGHKWSNLSGGYKLRFALARALAWKPKLLLLDEPLANLDFETQQLFLRDLRNLADSARHPLAVIISSQHLHEIEPFVDQVMFIDQGRPKFYGPIDWLSQRGTESLFEFNTDLSLSELWTVFRGLPVNDISLQGAYQMVRMRAGVHAGMILERFAQHGVKVHYFRNIGRSIKALFLD